MWSMLHRLRKIHFLYILLLIAPTNVAAQDASVFVGPIDLLTAPYQDFQNGMYYGDDIIDRFAGENTPPLINVTPLFDSRDAVLFGPSDSPGVLDVVDWPPGVEPPHLPGGASWDDEEFEAPYVYLYEPSTPTIEALCYICYKNWCLVCDHDD